MERVVLAYSGGLDTSVAIPYLREQGYEVVAVAVDVGQPGDLQAAIERAKLLGAVEARVVDVRDRYVEGYVLPALHMNALYGGRYPLVSALSRPVIAEVLAAVARETGASTVAHGCTGKGNDQVRFEVGLGALAPDLKVLAPVRDWGMDRGQTIAYAEERGLPIETKKSSPYSIDENLWGRAIECGVLEDPWAAAPDDIYGLTSEPKDAPGERDVEIGFANGVPVAVDGETLSPAAVIEVVNKIAGTHGYGRIDMVEDRLVGIKSREIYEAPAALALIAAHSDLESLVLERSVLREKRRLEAQWAQLVYDGLWFGPLRVAIEAFAQTTYADVTGDVKLRFGHGTCDPIGRRSSLSLYDPSLATYEGEDTFEHGDAAGFVRLWGLPTHTWARVHREG
jgi:argininosuccinate synthase